MKFEDQVCSLELSKRLKELGVKQDSEFFWELEGDNITSGKPEWTLRRKFRQDEFSYSAFSVAELGEMFPPDVDSGKSESGKFMCYTCDTEDGETWHYRRAEQMGVEFEPNSETADTEAAARAKMLIHLIEKGIVLS